MGASSPKVPTVCPLLPGCSAAHGAQHAHPRFTLPVDGMALGVAVASGVKWEAQCTGGEMEVGECGWTGSRGYGMVGPL